MAKHRIDPSKRVQLLKVVPYDKDATTSFENLQSGSQFVGIMSSATGVDRGTWLSYRGGGKFDIAASRRHAHAYSLTDVFAGEVGVLVVKL